MSFRNYIPLHQLNSTLDEIKERIIEGVLSQTEKVLTYENFEGGSKETLFPLKKATAQKLVCDSKRKNIMMIPHHKKGKNVFFHYSELVMWTKQNQQTQGV